MRHPVYLGALLIWSGLSLCFLSYVVAALRAISPNLGESALLALRSPQPPPTETLVADVLNEIADEADSFVLVLDDYHVLTQSGCW